jgi:hypothetical protein
MAVLEHAVIKDTTLMPGEWYGGQLHLAPPTEQGGYGIAIRVVMRNSATSEIFDSPRESDQALVGGSGLCRVHRRCLVMLRRPQPRLN